jgi:PqqD family protein of HPr-rel-A system
MAAAARYRPRGADRPRVYAFGNEVAVFNPVTWETHLLHASAAVVLESLAREPVPLDVIAARLCAGGRADDALQFATAMVDELMAAGLIEAESVDATR